MGTCYESLNGRLGGRLIPAKSVTWDSSLMAEARLEFIQAMFQRLSDSHGQLRHEVHDMDQRLLAVECVFHSNRRDRVADAETTVHSQRISANFKRRDLYLRLSKNSSRP